MSGPAMQAVGQLQAISHLPASMNGSPVLYATTLTAMMCGVVIGLYVLFWMGRDILRDREHARFKSVLFNFRLMMGICGLTAVMGCFPEVLYLQSYGDPTIGENTLAAIIVGKRVVDSLRIYMIIGWASLLVMIYPYVSLALLAHDDHVGVTHLQVEDYPGLGRLLKPAIVFVTLAFVAMAFAFSKVYGA